MQHISFIYSIFYETKFYILVKEFKSNLKSNFRIKIHSSRKYLYYL